MLYVFSTVAIFVGSVVGAGFASGREIALYFGAQSVAAPVAAGVIIGFLCYVFLEIGRISDGNVLGVMFGKFGKAAGVLLRLANFAVYCAMIAGAEFIMRDTFGFRGAGVLSGILCIVCLSFKKGLAAMNVVLTPLIVVLVGILASKADNFDCGEGYSFWSPLSYASMNLATGGYLISHRGASSTVKKNAAAGLATAVVTTALLVAVYFTVRKYPDAEMPLYLFACRNGMAVLSGILIYAAILTTMVSSLAATVPKGGFIGAAAVTSAAFLVAVLGFGRIVNVAYPVIGCAGIAFTAWALIVLIVKKHWRSTRLNPLFDKRNRRVHKSRKYAENES